MTGGKQPGGGDKSKSMAGANQRSFDADKRTTSKMPHMVTRLPISDLNQHLTCALCTGYMVDATTVVECLHSFCRSCLLRYLETSSTCPICDTQINKAQLDKCVRADHTLQDLVYKLVPGLYKSELRRRKDFYLEQCKSVADDGPSSSSSSKSEPVVPGGMQIFDKHLVELSAFICTPDEIISFSLETTPKKSQDHSPTGKSSVQNSSSAEGTVASEQRSSASTSSAQQHKSKEAQTKIEELHFKRYFRCPAAVTVGHLKKLLAYKMDLSNAHQVEILHSDEPLLDEYTLMDIAYIYTWRRKAPMQLFFNICKYETEEEPMPLLEPEIVAPTTSSAVVPIVSPAIAATSSNILSQDVKPDVTTPSSSSSHPRVLDTIGASGGKKCSNSDAKKDIAVSATAPAIPAVNGTIRESTPANVESSATKEPKYDKPVVRTVIPTVRCRRPSPPSAETSMRGKPPLPIDRGVDFLNKLNQQKSRSAPVVFNGKTQPIRFTPTPSCNGKKKSKNGGETTKQTNARKAKTPKLVPTSPAILAALQKITGFVTGATTAIHPSAPIAKSNVAPPMAVVPTMKAISVDTTAKTVLSPTSSAQSSVVVSTSEDSVSPLSSPAHAYKPTAAQSACTQPAKLRLKKSLSSVVQELSSNALEACSPSKKSKFENGGGEERGATLIH